MSLVRQFSRSALLASVVAASAFGQEPSLKLVCGGGPQGGASDVWVMETDGSRPINLTSGFAPDVESSYVHVSPDGKRIVFTAITAGRNQIFMMNSNGTGLVQLTTLNHQYGPVGWGWLDNDRVIMRWAPGASQGDIYTLNVNTLAQALLVRASAFGQASIDWASVSPDRTKIALTAQAGSWSPTTDVYWYDLTTGTAHVLYADSPDDYQDWQAEWIDNDRISWSHNSTRGLADNFGIVWKSITSPVAVGTYDGVLVPFAPGTVGLATFLPAFDRMVYTRFSVSNVRSRVLSSGVERIISPLRLQSRYAMILVDTYCPGDFNLDGGVDGDDVIEFFESWDSGC